MFRLSLKQEQSMDKKVTRSEGKSTAWAGSEKGKKDI
jgi:hypothetical protein